MIPIHDDNPTEIRPVVTVVLILVCCLVFVWQLATLANDPAGVYYRYGMIPAVLTGHSELLHDLAAIPPWSTVVTSLFLHGSGLHLGGNMLYLWIFGNNIEDAMGHGRFFVFYLLCGISAALVQAFTDTTSLTPVIGASGAVSGILAAYLLLYPTARIRLFIPLIVISVFHLRAVWVLGIWIVLQLVGSTLQPPASEAGGGIAYAAHIGGFVIGLLLTGLFKAPDLVLHNPLSALRRREAPDQPGRSTNKPSAPASAGTRDYSVHHPDTLIDDLARDRGRLRDLE